MPAPVVSYWPGGALDYLRYAGLASCIRAGHAVTLWMHGPVPNVPAGVMVRDAHALLDPVTVPVANRSLVANRMRWLTLAAQPGAIFISPGVMVQRELVPDAQGYLFGWQDAQYLCADPVALPADSPELTALIGLGADPAPVPAWLDDDLQGELRAAASRGNPVPAGHLPWGMLGAVGLTHVLRASGRIASAHPVHVLSPVAYADRAVLLARKGKLGDLVRPDTLAVQIWPSEMLREISETLSGLPRYWCPVGEILRGIGVNPRRHLPNGTALHIKDDRWKDRADKAPIVSTQHQADPAAPAAAPRICVLSCMKNEGPFILEWIAHNRAIGVTDFVIYTNDCTDGTDALLDLLVEKGIVTARFDNPWKPDTAGMSNPQFTAFKDAEERPEIQAADWLMPLDVDEFIDIRTGDGTLAALFAALPGVDTISIPWRLFGNDGQHRYEDAFVTERFHRAAIERCKKPYQALGFKTMYRNDGRWQTISVHRPKNPDPAREAEISWASGCGLQMMPAYRDSGWRMQKDWAGYDLVSLNHYAVRDAESYLVKRDRGRVNHVSEDQGLGYWFRMNHNVVEERSIMPRLAATRAEYARLMADADIAAAHQASVAAHRARIATLHDRPDMAALHAAITAPVMDGLSRVTPHFGNRIFDAGPQALPDPVLEWASAGARIKRPLPDTLHDPVPLPAQEADPNRLLPAGSDLHLAHVIPEEPVEPVVASSAAVAKPAASSQPAARAAGVAPSGDPIYLGEDDRRAFAALLERTQPRYPMLEAPAVPLPNDNIVVITSMKNEAPFILEWIAWHRAVGAEHFLVYTNDCTDQTNPMLDRLAQMGLVTRLENPFNREGGQKPQRGALNDAIRQPIVRNSDWYLVIDCDEFLNVHVGDGTMQGMLAAMNNPDIVSMTWRFFGNGNVHAYEDRPVTEQFVRCAPEYLPRPRLGWGFKSMARPSGPSDKIGVHRPLDLDQNRDIRWVNGSGRIMPEKSMGNSTWFSRKASIGYDMVTLNHYILRSAESFLVKRERGRINHVDQDQGLAYWTARNYSTETDTRAAQFMAQRVAPVLAELKADPELSRLHAEAVEWHRARIAYLKAQPDYLALYNSITDPELPDAIYVAEVEEGGDD